jgi:SAM-dependent methyltransferase
MTNSPIDLSDVQKFFGDKVTTHGPNHKGADYSQPTRQDLCFDQLMKINHTPTQPFSIIDYGCGYGALIEYMLRKNYPFSYTGYDLTPAMLAQAKATYAARPECAFVDAPTALKAADYLIMGGIFNLLFDHTYEAWTDYVVETLEAAWKLAQKGMAFNILTKYSDADKMRSDLYYADPLFYFDYCKRHFSKEVALLHDYGVYEFTILVRRA